MSPEKLLKILLNPKKYTQSVYQNGRNARDSELIKNEFFLPINEIRPSDIHIVGFPKSGNTWMQSLMAGVQFGCDPKLMSDHLAQEIVPDVHARTLYKRFGKFNFFKSHELPQPWHKNVIYIVRDGRDAMVSYFHYNRKLKINVTMNEMIFENKEIFPSSWSVHVRSWLNNPHSARIIFVRYEDLLTNPVEELKRICQFSYLDRTDDLLTVIANGNSFDQTKARAIASDGIAHKDWSGKQGHEFFRKGISGDFINEMSESQVAFFNQSSKNELLHFNYSV